MNGELTIGFIGFGEAVSSIANGLREDGVARLFAFDINTDTPRLGDRIRGRAQAAEVALPSTPKSFAASCSILFSTVTADQALQAAEQTAPFLEARHIFADLNSVSPSTKQSIALIVEASSNISAGTCPTPTTR